MAEILVIVNPQNDFVNGSMSNDNSMKILPDMVHVIKEHVANNNPIFVVQDTHTKNYRSTPEGKKNPMPHCIVRTDGWKVHEKIQDALNLAEPGNVTFLQKEAFASFDLVKQLKDTVRSFEERIRNIKVIGYLTDVDVLNNAILIKNNFKQIPTSVLSYACSGTNEDLHNSALDVMESSQINIIEL